MPRSHYSADAQASTRPHISAHAEAEPNPQGEKRSVMGLARRRVITSDGESLGPGGGEMKVEGERVGLKEDQLE